MKRGEAKITEDTVKSRIKAHVTGPYFRDEYLKKNADESKMLIKRLRRQ